MAYFYAHENQEKDVNVFNIEKFLFFVKYSENVDSQKFCETRIDRKNKYVSLKNYKLFLNIFDLNTEAYFNFRWFLL